MADSVKITMDLDGAGGNRIRRLFARLQDPEPALRDFGEFKRRRIVLSFPRMPRLQRSIPGEPPAKRTASLAQRITYEVAGDVLDVGTYDIRARILHFGGTIVPVKAKALSVPIHADAQGKRTKDFGNLDYIPRKGRAPLLVRKILDGSKRKGARWDIMFILLKSVTIPARPFLLWRQPQDEQYLETALQRQFDAEAAG